MQQIDQALQEKSAQKAPDYSLGHENLGRKYGQIWQSASHRMSSRILWFLILLLYGLFISIPMVQVLLSGIRARLQ